MKVQANANALNQSQFTNLNGKNDGKDVNRIKDQEFVIDRIISQAPTTDTNGEDSALSDDEHAAKIYSNNNRVPRKKRKMGFGVIATNSLIKSDGMSRNLKAVKNLGLDLVEEVRGKGKHFRWSTRKSFMRRYFCLLL